MCGSMVDIQSPTAEIRQGKKNKKPQGKNIMSASATQGDHNNYLITVAIFKGTFLYEKRLIYVFNI